ncbi:major capsid protein [Streptomyces sp. NPDC019531]|uniref:major capsid protein n=1 Tax=Streptomyces sp. NPDC019531 TaxID=3365062 RepID=UPI00384C5C0D
MAREKLLEAIVPEDIQAFIRAITTPEGYLLTREVFAEGNIDNVKFRTKSSKRRVNAAKFRAWEAAPTLARRRAEQVINEGMLPWVGQELPFSELQIILAAVNRGQDTSEFLDLLYDDLEQHVEATKAAMEIAAGQMLSAGVVSLLGVALDVDWKVPAANRPMVAVPWSRSEAATPITDELAWIQYLKSIGAPRPERVKRLGEGAVAARVHVGVSGRVPQLAVDRADPDRDARAGGGQQGPGQVQPAARDHV